MATEPAGIVRQSVGAARIRSSTTPRATSSECRAWNHALLFARFVCVLRCRVAGACALERPDRLSSDRTAANFL